MGIFQPSCPCPPLHLQTNSVVYFLGVWIPAHLCTSRSPVPANRILRTHPLFETNSAWSFPIFFFTPPPPPQATTNAPPNAALEFEHPLQTPADIFAVHLFFGVVRSKTSDHKPPSRCGKFSNTHVVAVLQSLFNPLEDAFPRPSPLRAPQPVLQPTKLIRWIFPS